MSNYSQLKAMLAITKASLKGMTRNPSSIIFSIIFPVIFIAIFGVLGGGSTKYEIYIDQTSNKDANLSKVINQIEILKPVEFANYDEAYKELAKGKLSAIIKVSNDKGKETIELTTSQASQANGSIITSILKGIVNDINIKTNKTVEYASLKVNQIQGREYKQIDFILPGQLGFALLNSGIFGSAFVILSLKETLVLKRFFATPIKRLYILVGEGIARLVFSALQAVLIIAIGYFFFDFTLIHGIWTAIEMIIMSLFGLMVFLGMGLMISSLAKDENSVAPIANLFTLPQFLLGGVFFPTDVFPKWLQAFAQILPLTHLSEAMRKIAFEGAGISDVAINVLVLLIWSVVVYTLTAKFFKWDK